MVLDHSLIHSHLPFPRSLQPSFWSVFFSIVVILRVFYAILYSFVEKGDVWPSAVFPGSFWTILRSSWKALLGPDYGAHNTQSKTRQCSAAQVSQDRENPRKLLIHRTIFPRCNSTWGAELCFTTTRGSKFFKPGYLYTLQVPAQTPRGHNKTFGSCQVEQLHKKANSV